MPRYFYLYPSHHGPFPNPFTGNDPLVRLPQEAITSFREYHRTVESAEDSQDTVPMTSASLSEYESAVDSVAREACCIAFPILFNRMLEAGPPTETHLDHALSEIAARTVALGFYTTGELTSRRMRYARKRELEALIVDWSNEAKDIWRKHVLDPDCRILMELPKSQNWHVPTLATWIGEGLWEIGPTEREMPESIRESLYVPPIHPAVALSDVKVWIDQALAPTASTTLLKWQVELRNRQQISNPLRYPERAAWLLEALAVLGWGDADPYAHGGPDRKTVKKILAGESVSNHVLKKLADALKIDVLTIPRG